MPLYRIVMKKLWWLSFILILCGAFSAFAQPAALSAAGLKSTVITMKQEAPKGLGSGINSSYVVTLSGDGNITFDGMDEGRAISRYEPPVKVIRRYKITPKQFKELVDEFYKLDFFALDESYCCRDNGDGTISVIKDGGLANVITSIKISGKTKTVTNINFAPETLVELQRKIFTASNIAQFVKLPPYWLLKFPNQLFPPRSSTTTVTPPTPQTISKIEYRKISRRSPENRKVASIDLDKQWGFITPCLTTKTQAEKILGKPIPGDDAANLPTYNSKNEKIRLLYSTEKTARACGEKAGITTIILYSVIPIRDIKLSELKIDLSKFQKDTRPDGKEMSYRNRDEGIFIETEIVEFSDKIQAEMVTSIQFTQNLKKQKNAK